MAVTRNMYFKNTIYNIYKYLQNVEKVHAYKKVFHPFV